MDAARFSGARCGPLASASKAFRLAIGNAKYGRTGPNEIKHPSNWVMSVINTLRNDVKMRIVSALDSEFNSIKQIFPLAAANRQGRNSILTWVPKSIGLHVNQGPRGNGDSRLRHRYDEISPFPQLHCLSNFDRTLTKDRVILDLSLACNWK